MRILVLSDSHGDIPTLAMAVEAEKSAEAVIFLGDGLSDFENIQELLRSKRVLAVRGNCDSSLSPYPVKTIDIFDGNSIYCTHGYAEKVKFGLKTLISEAIQADCNIALFGHTHVPYTSYNNGLHILNPGSVKQNSCGIIDITKNGIMCFTKKIVS